MDDGTTISTSTAMTSPSGAAPTRGSTTWRTDEARWRAVGGRSRAADGAFVFAVRTTGIYCRPSCPSRRARRENVRFFATCDDAERAGFRACRRCHPRRASVEGPLTAAVAAACRSIATAPEGGAVRLEALARAAGYSPAHFHRAFKRIVGMTPRAYGEAQRVRALRDGLASGRDVAASIAEAGFASPSRVYERHDRLLGMSPGAVRRRGSAQSIRYVTTRTPLGWLLVATTERGICAVSLGDTRKALEEDLRARFARARCVAADPTLAAHVAKVLAFLDDPAGGLSLPLDVRGTAFQHRVWQALRTLPPGSRTTYGDLAAALGRPRAVRAVALAIASNPAALAIPCHRVVAKDGALAGYRWGILRKAKLLEREASLLAHEARAARRDAAPKGGRGTTRHGR
jgi:AraC family transcriptional regulator of adaptative response/methylated-DNA-[protein]-cysteine methyltransferase